MKILQAAAEHYGLAKTGGLADMVASLSTTMSRLGHDVKVCLPAYTGTIEHLRNVQRGQRVTIHGHTFEVVTGQLPDVEQTVFLLDCPELFARAGDPYRDEHGVEFPDNGWRFGCFNQAVAELVRAGFGDWRPDLVHLHDWHLGLAAALLKRNNAPVKTLFTIHNFSFHGIFGRDLFNRLQLPEQWWHSDELEFYGQFSFMKAGLKYSDRVTTVSPRYAREIQTAAFGCGLEGMVRHHADRLEGIVNGIDQDAWNPAKDTYIETTYNRRTLTSGKKANKAALQKVLGLPVKDVPLAIFIGRLAEQKGPDLILGARAVISELPMQLAVLGCGEKPLEQAFTTWAVEAPEQVACVIDIDEKMAHLFTAAADLQLMPSRFEPCGLSQMYAQRYGALPVAHATGGLADTIVDAAPKAVEAGTATGFLFDSATTENLAQSLQRALTLIGDKNILRKMRQTAMGQDFSWDSSARAYLDLYQTLLAPTGRRRKAISGKAVLTD